MINKQCGWGMYWGFSSYGDNKYYKIRDAKVKLNNEFVVKFYECHNTGQLLASWWKEDKKFVNRAS
jgi:hypothetical protein